MCWGADSISLGELPLHPALVQAIPVGQEQGAKAWRVCGRHKVCGEESEGWENLSRLLSGGLV